MELIGAQVATVYGVGRVERVIGGYLSVVVSTPGFGDCDRDSDHGDSTESSVRRFTLSLSKVTVLLQGPEFGDPEFIRAAVAFLHRRSSRQLASVHRVGQVLYGCDRNGKIVAKVPISEAVNYVC